jgi:hypothetical protein
MSVNRRCRAKRNALELDIGNGERLRYEMGLPDGEAEFTLDEHPTKQGLADSHSCPPTCSREWPRDAADVPQQDQVKHTLAVQFLSPGTLTYRVEHRRADGSVDTVIDCDYKCDGSDGAFFEPLDIFLKR